MGEDSHVDITEQKKVDVEGQNDKISNRFTVDM